MDNVRHLQICDQYFDFIRGARSRARVCRATVHCTRPAGPTNWPVNGTIYVRIQPVNRFSYTGQRARSGIETNCGRGERHGSQYALPVVIDCHPRLHRSQARSHRSGWSGSNRTTFRSTNNFFQNALLRALSPPAPYHLLRRALIPASYLHEDLG